MSKKNKSKKPDKDSATKKTAPAWQQNYLPLAVVLLVLVAAAIVLYPKFFGQENRGTSSEVKATAGTSTKRALDEALAKNQVTVLCFHSTTCQPCIEMDEIIEEIEPTFKGKVAFISVIVDDPEERLLIEKYEIQMIPTTFIFDKEGNAQKTVGVIEKDKFISTLDKLVNE